MRETYKRGAENCERSCNQSTTYSLEEPGKHLGSESGHREHGKQQSGNREPPSEMGVGDSYDSVNGRE